MVPLMGVPQNIGMAGVHWTPKTGTLGTLEQATKDNRTIEEALTCNLVASLFALEHLGLHL